MESNHEFTVQLTGEDAYVIKLLERVQIERRDGVVVGHWPAFNLDAKGANEDEVYQQLLGGLREQMGAGPGSPEFEPFAAYVREHGRRLSEEEAAARELAQLRELTIRWGLTEDEQYSVRLFADAEVRRDGDTVAVRAFGLEGSGEQLGEAVQKLNTAINEACGVPDAPGPRFEEITSWVRSNGEPVPADVLGRLGDLGRGGGDQGEGHGDGDGPPRSGELPHHLELDAISRGEQRGRIRGRIEQNSRSPADQPPSSGRGGRIHAGPRSPDRNASRRNTRPGRRAPRRGELGRKPEEVRESRREADEGDPVSGCGVPPCELGGRKTRALRDVVQVLAVVHDRQSQEASPLLDSGRRQGRALHGRGDEIALRAQGVIDHQQRARRRDRVLDVPVPAQAPAERDGGTIGLFVGHVRELDEHRALAKVEESGCHDLFSRRQRK